MKFLIYSVNFAPDLVGIGKYSGEMAAWLAQQGHTVHAVVAPPYYPMWKRRADYPAAGYQQESWQGIKIWRAPLWVPRSPSGLTRILHLLSFAITSIPIMLRHIAWHPDVILCVAPAFVCAPVGLLTARLSGAQAWLHIQDFEIDVAFEMGLLKGKLLQKLVLGMERWLLRRFDSVSSISNRMVERLFKKGVPRERIQLFPNWVDMSRIFPLNAESGYRKQLNIGRDTVTVLFSGSLGGKQGLMVIPEVAKLLAERQDVVFVICGDGVMKPRLEEAAAGLPNVRFLPLQPSERLGELLGMADLHLLPQSPTAQDLVLPSKLSGMLASGRAVIATCNQGTELESVVSKCGVVVPPEDPPALAQAIIRLADDRAMRVELGRRARAWAEANIDRDTVLRRVFGPVENPLASDEVHDAAA
jgi:colanic acid biosynthesis glycosyl transferase WcaI